MTHSIYSKINAAALCLLMAAPAQYASAQSVRKLTLNEAVQLSINNSGQLKTANAKVDEAVAQYHQAWNNHLPDVKVTGAYMRLNNPDIDLKIKTGQSGSSDSSKSATSGIKVSEAAYGMVNASLPIFSGLRIKYGTEAA